MAQFSLDGLLLPYPGQYSTVEEWAEALTSQLQTQLEAALTTIGDNSEDSSSGGGGLSLPINDTAARPIVTEDGLIVYDGTGTAVINENIVNIDTSHLADAAITTAKINDSAVDNAKLAALSVDAAKLADSAVTSTKIANLAVGAAAIAAAAIGTAHISNAAITSALIGDAQVVEAKIADLAVTNAKIVDLNANKITTGVISTSLLNLDGVGLVNNSGELTIGTIVTNDLQDAAVTNVKIAGGLSASKITTGTLDASLATITNINASNITTGALNASLITTGTLSAARLDLDGITLQNNGGVLEVSTVDWSTNVGGANKPDDNATDGATAGPGGNLTTYYSAGSGLLASAPTTRSVTSSTYTLVKSFSVAGSGTVTFGFGRLSDNDALAGHQPAAIQWRQGATVLATQSTVYGNGTWINNVTQDVTLDNDTDNVDIYMKNDEPLRTISIRNVNMLANIANGETVVTD